MKFLSARSITQFILHACVLLSLVACREDTSDKKETLPDSDKPLTTSQLKVLAEMKFTSHANMNLAVDIANQGGGPAYLSVYSKYSQNENAHWVINYESRLLASYMINNQVQQEFAIPQHLSHLLVQVWFYDDRAPLSKEIRINPQQSIVF
jgi:hypothetical protein